MKIDDVLVTVSWKPNNSMLEETLVQYEGEFVRVNENMETNIAGLYTMGASEGFTKIIVEKKHGEILGAVLAGPHVTEMIGEPAAYIHLEGTVDELASMVHPHPTLLEQLYEAAHSWLGKGIHH